MDSNKAASTNPTYVVQNSFPPYCPCNPQTGEVYYQTFYPPMPPMMDVAGAQAIHPSNIGNLILLFFTKFGHFVLWHDFPRQFNHDMNYDYTKFQIPRLALALKLFSKSANCNKM